MTNPYQYQPLSNDASVPPSKDDSTRPECPSLKNTFCSALATCVILVSFVCFQVFSHGDSFHSILLLLAMLIVIASLFATIFSFSSHRKTRAFFQYTCSLLVLVYAIGFGVLGIYEWVCYQVYGVTSEYRLFMMRAYGPSHRYIVIFQTLQAIFAWTLIWPQLRRSAFSAASYALIAVFAIVWLAVLYSPYFDNL